MEHKSPRSRFTIERVLLAAVLILQVGILLLLTSRSPSPARSGPGDSGTTPVPNASRRTLSDGQAPRQDQLPPSARAQYASPGSGRRMVVQMERMFERTVGDLEEIGRVGNLDDGWDRLMAMPSFDVRDRGNSYHVRFTLPDGNPRGTELTLQGRVLTIAVPAPAYSRQGPVLMRYNRQIMLPGPVAEATSARAFVTNGLLYVVVPKATVPSSAQAAVRPVQVFAQ